MDLIYAQRELEKNNNNNNWSQTIYFSYNSFKNNVES